MPKCAKCDKPANPKGVPPTLCENHQRLKKQDDEKQARVKKQMEDKLKATEEARKEAALKAAKNEKDAAEKKKQIALLATQWNAQVKTVVTQVKNLRRLNPGNTGINAGKNGALGTIPGGTDNPISFALPSSNPHKITKAEVYKEMAGFEGSDSGSFKFRVDTVFVHGH
jgi:Tfp pilus assembly protein FimV